MHTSPVAHRPLLLLWLSLALLPFAGCHSADKPVELPAAPAAPTSLTAEPAVSGELSKLLEVVPGSYQSSTTYDGDHSYETTVKLKVRLLQSAIIKAGRGYNDFGPVLTARLHDASGAPLDDLDHFSTQASYGGNLASLLKQGKGEEWLTFTTTKYFSGLGEEEKAALPAQVAKYLAAVQSAKKISLTSQVEAERFEKKDAATASASGTTADATSNDSGGDCDAFLAGYEEYVNDYVALAQEMQADPTNAALLTKSSAMSMKAAQWAGKAKGCENDPDFQAKYAALSSKMALGMAQGQ